MYTILSLIRCFSHLQILLKFGVISPTSRTFTRVLSKIVYNVAYNLRFCLVVLKAMEIPAAPILWPFCSPWMGTRCHKVFFFFRFWGRISTMNLTPRCQWMQLEGILKGSFSCHFTISSDVRTNRYFFQNTTWRTKSATGGRHIVTERLAIYGNSHTFFGIPGPKLNVTLAILKISPIMSYSWGKNIRKSPVGVSEIISILIHLWVLLRAANVILKFLPVSRTVNACIIRVFQ